MIRIWHIGLVIMLIIASSSAAKTNPFAVDEGDGLRFRITSIVDEDGHRRKDVGIPMLTSSSSSTQSSRLFPNQTLRIEITHIIEYDYLDSSQYDQVEFPTAKIWTKHFELEVNLLDLSILFVTIPGYTPEVFNTEGHDFDKNGILTRYEGDMQIPLPAGSFDYVSAYVSVHITMIRLWPLSLPVFAGLVGVIVGIPLLIYVFVILRRKKREQSQHPDDSWPYINTSHLQ